MKGQGLPQGLVVGHFANGKAKHETGISGLESCLAAEMAQGEQAAYLTDDGDSWDCWEVWVWALFFFFLVSRCLEALSKAGIVLDQKLA